MPEKFYSLPKLSYAYDALEPHISDEQLRVHHDKHHKAYVDKANKILEKIDDARKQGKELDHKSVLKSLSWNVGGHILHSIFWKNLTPEKKEFKGMIKDEIRKEFGSLDRFKEEFESTAKSVEGSGWAALTYCKKTNRLLLMQIEKHNTNIHPMFDIIMVLDIFEHAYYIDRKNEKMKYVKAFWDIVDWDTVNKRLEMGAG